MECIQCGGTDVNNFYVTNKSRCKSCIKINKAKQKLPKTVKPHLCIECGETDINKFYSNCKSKCKQCQSSKTNNRYHSLSTIQKQAYKDNLKNWNNNNIFRVRYNVGKHRAAKKGILFNIDESHLQQLWKEQQGLCFYSDIQMSLLQDDATYSISIERKDSSIGYTQDNVVLCCSAVNRMKNKMDSDTFFTFINAIHQKNFDPK